jgi:hypothetical protein
MMIVGVDIETHPPHSGWFRGFTFADLKNGGKSPPRTNSCGIVFDR